MLVDVSGGAYYAGAVSQLVAAGVTAGCGGSPGTLLYCPSAPVTRADMAIFLLRAVGTRLADLPPATGRFSDVPSDAYYARWVEELARRVITAGCGTDSAGQALYCPTQPVTRGDMSIFLLRALGVDGSTLPPYAGTFSDVPASAYYARWAEQLYRQHLTSGCVITSGQPAYCPTRPVIRGDMALFLTRAFPALTTPAATSRISISSDGNQTREHRESEGLDPIILDDSYGSSLSADGRYVTFTSAADNLVPGDTNNTSDVFVRDRQTNTTSRVSVANDGTQADGSSGYSVAISADARYVSFVSTASNLVPRDTNGRSDVFVRDRQTNTTSRVSVASDGTQADGYGADTDYGLAISADGRYVAFTSDATNLVPGDTNNTADVFVRDRQANITSRVSVASDGTQANSDGYGSYSGVISADGRYVAFASAASNLVPGDTNNTFDVFVRDRQTTTTSRMSVASDGTQANSDGYGYGSHSGAISADGRYVAFASAASNLVPGDTNNTFDVFVRDRQTNTTSRVSIASDGTQAANGSYGVAISGDGRYVAFTSDATNIVSGDTNRTGDVFVRDRQTNTTIRVSVASDGAQADAYSVGVAISADGRYVAFDSDASNLVPGDTNSAKDVFVRDRGQ